MTDGSSGRRPARPREPEPRAEPPYFYLSYAPMAGAGKRDGVAGTPGPDAAVSGFFHDLSERIRALLGLPPGAPIGHLPAPEPAEPWPGRAAELALAGCKVFVPLYCERYFNNERCGRQWSAFWARVSARGATARHSVVPVLWRTTQPESLPEPVAALAFEHAAFGQDYAAYGLAVIVKLQRYREDYLIAVDRIARRVISVAHVADLAPGEPVDLSGVPNAFGDRPSSRRLHVSVVASCVPDLPPGRDLSYYGASPLDWNPYRPASSTSLADHVDNLARNLDFQPDTRTFEETRKDLLADGTPTGPGLLIVDVWALLDDRCRSLLRTFDALVKPWVGVLVPWNAQDGQTVGAEERLRGALNEALGRKLAEGRIASRAAVRGIPTLDDFDQALTEVLASVKRQYLRSALAFPPAEPGTGRPYLKVPDSRRTGGQPGEGANS